MVLARQFHTELFDSEAEAEECIDFYDSEEDPFDDPEIEGPDKNGKYSISALYEK